MDQIAGGLFQVLGMEEIKKTLKSVLLLLRQDDSLPAAASVAVVEAGEKDVKEGACCRENQGVCQEWFSATFYVQSHIKVDQRS